MFYIFVLSESGDWNQPLFQRQAIGKNLAAKHGYELEAGQELRRGRPVDPWKRSLDVLARVIPVMFVLN